MIEVNEILQTMQMIREQHFDIRTITMGISLLDCKKNTDRETAEAVYEKVTQKAKNLVRVGCELEMMDLLCDEKTHIFVDPAFGDFGRMYSLMDESMPAQMRRLCARARTIVPNVTEASYLLGLPYPGEQADEKCLEAMCHTLLAIGPENVVITDVNFLPGQTGVAILRRGMEKPLYLFHERFEGLFHGTGDVFASFLLGALMNDQALEEAAQTAMALTHEAIRQTLASGEHLRYGMQFESVLPEFLRRIGRL